MLEWGAGEARRDQPVRVIAIADRAQEHLWKRSCRLTSKGKPTQKVGVAMARELVGYLWAVLRPEAGLVAAE